MSRNVKLNTSIVAPVVGSSKLLSVPAGAVIACASTGTKARILEPAHLNGTIIRYVATADEPSDNAAVPVNGVTPKPEPTPEHLAHREHYRSTIKGVLRKILDWENLPAVDAESFAHGIRDLGRVTDFADAHVAASSKRLRAWLHHVNMEIPSRSLTVELAQLPNQEKHLVLVLTTVW